jgi:hypothetical protein
MLDCISSRDAIYFINKYRVSLSKAELLEAEYWTSDDIKDYLKHNGATVLR